MFDGFAPRLLLLCKLVFLELDEIAYTSAKDYFV